MSGCALILDNFRGPYFAGDMIVGRIVCIFRNPKSVRAIQIRLTGREHTKWTRTERNSDGNMCVVKYEGNSDILRIEQILSRKGDYPAGTHEYHFKLILPKHLPPTYETRYGYIKYFIKAIVDRPYRIDYKNTKEFVLMSPIDFNNMPCVPLNPVIYSDESTLGCCCCTSGSLTMSVHLEKEAFVVGETARVKVKITNLSNVRVSFVQARIKSTIKSTVRIPKTGSNIDKELIASDIDSRGIGTEGRKTYELKLTIPKSTAVYNFVNCKLFSQTIMLKVSAKVESCGVNLEVSVPLVLGHKPFRRVPFQNTPAQQTYPVPNYSPPPYSQVESYSSAPPSAAFGNGSSYKNHLHTMKL